MRIRTIREKAKRLSHLHVLAVVFLAAIFCIGITALPSIKKEIVALAKAESPDLVYTAGRIKNLYLNFLEFKGNILVNKGSYINLNGFCARLMGQRNMNSRIRLGNGHLAALERAYDVNLAATQLTKLCARQKESGSGFLFVLAPGQIPKYEDILPVGYSDYSNRNADNLLEMLSARGVPYLDLREEMLADGIDHTEAFYVTDHHWKPEIGFWAYTKIVGYLEQSGALRPVDAKYTDIGAYDMEMRKAWFLGASGRRTGIYFAGLDDFGILSPKDPDFGKEVVFERPSTRTFVQGSFRDVIFNYRTLQDDPDYFRSEPYGKYGYGNSDLKLYRNEAAESALKITAIGDSFALSTFPFLSLVAESVDFLEMPRFSGDFGAYYSEYRPDVVIVLVCATDLDSTEVRYDFFGDLVVGKA